MKQYIEKNTMISDVFTNIETFVSQWYSFLAEIMKCGIYAEYL